MPDQPLDLARLLTVPLVEPEYGYDISPDGKHIAYSSNPTGQWQIYTIPVDGSASPRPLTTSPGAKFCPKYHPEKAWLYYFQDLDGSENFDLFLYDQENDRHTNLTPDTPEAIIPDLSFSPDAEQVSLLSDAPGSFSLFRLPAAGGVPQLVCNPDLPVFSATWSPGGDWIALVAEGLGQDMALFIASPETGDVRQLELDGKPLNAHGPCWSPDGKRLAFAAENGEYAQIGIFDLSEQKLSWLTAGETDKASPDWSPDGKLVAYIQGYGPDTHVVVHDLESDRPAIFQADSGVHYHPLFTPDSRSVLFAFDNHAHPTDLWLLNLDTTEIRQLTHSLPEEFHPADFIRPDHIWYPGLDGTPVPALLFRPREAVGLPPAVIVPHGGPSWLFQDLWYPIFQHMVSRGWVVLAPNYRGSTGYGRSWQTANRFKLGFIDTDDVTAGRDYLVKEGIADPKRIAITGRSHGGYLTMTCLTQYPERFSGGSAIVPFLNRFTSFENLRQDLQHWDIQNMGDPQENFQLWYDSSPYFFLERLQAPVQLVCGANDPRCPAEDSQESYEKMKSLGKDAELVLYPDEGHAFLKRENVIDHEQRRIGFIQRCIEG